MKTTQPAALLTARALRKGYGRGETRVEAVAGVDLDLHPGEIVAIMGASGSGKTTLLHLLAGLVRADSGVIALNGVDLTAASDRKMTELRGRHLGVVFQAYNLLPTLSALDNVALPLLLTGSPRAAARAAAGAVLETVGLQSSMHRRPAQLSGGEQQRVALARALANNPRVILADEPTGNLDRGNVQLVCQLFREVAFSSARALAVVTHDPFVAAIADRMVVLADGRVADHFQREAAGSTEEISRRCLRAAERFTSPATQS